MFSNPTTNFHDKGDNDYFQINKVTYYSQQSLSYSISTTYTLTAQKAS